VGKSKPKAKRKQDKRRQVTLSLDATLWARAVKHAKADHRRTNSSLVELALEAYLPPITEKGSDA